MRINLKFKRKPRHYYVISARGDAAYFTDSDEVEVYLARFKELGADCAVYELKKVHRAKQA